MLTIDTGIGLKVKGSEGADGLRIVDGLGG
jgi:hypothetical protein